MSAPDGLHSSGHRKHDVEINPRIIAPDPFASDDCLDVFSPVLQFLPPEPEELNTMNSSEDEPSSGLNGRLRPRKTNIPSSKSIKQIVRKLNGKSQEKPKRTSTPSKASPSKLDDLPISHLLPIPELLCPYCDKKFVSKQAISKHARRLHLSDTKPDYSMICLFCNHVETEPIDIIRHMVDSHPNQYFACLDCLSRFPSTKELAEHKLNVCEKQKIPYRNKLRQKSTKKNPKSLDTGDKDFRSGNKNFAEHGFNGIVISCELKPSHIHDEADIEDNITTNLILPPSKNLNNSSVLDKNAIIVLDDIQWNRRIPSNFSFHNTDTDQILSRLGVVHRSPKTGDSSKKDWFRAIEDATQKFEKCFDTSFYSKVASNVQENLTKFLDGSFNFNPDPDSTIKTRKSKNSVVINTAEGFPILLACEQFSRNNFDGYMPRTIAPKHKWKWDNLENDRHWNPDQIKRDTHANNCIITLVSSLDIWTQLRMRRKYEDKFNITPVEKKTEKQNVISKQLKEILESREIPSAKSQIVKYTKETIHSTNERDFPGFLGLMPSTPNFNIKPAILSGEWVRPRCYVCCACGAQTRDSRALGAHVSSQHPNSQIQYYEIVGESLLKADILRHLYVPPSQNFNRTRPPRGFKDCTKCNKSITIEDLHQHMLDCAGDTPQVRRKCRYRPFGVRKRRPRLPDNRIRKKMRNDIRTRPNRQKNRMRPRPKIRTEVGDAETIRKMLADLPAKRHRVLVNPLNSILRPRRKHDKQRAMLRMKRRTSEDIKHSKSRASNSAIQLDLLNTDKNSLSNNDDDDNKPLKPRLKRVTRKVTRQKDSLNRKEIFSKQKKKVPTSIFENKDNDSEEQGIDVPTSSPKKVQTVQLSTDHNQKRINLNDDSQNVREHSSGRGGSNNGRRDNQGPGCSGQNGNSRNVCAPVQNVPLKHSIARLTANSETHDKSVQFHQMFLIQQECNNLNQHDPTCQRVLFENEAVVTKLDKPPLHFNQMHPAHLDLLDENRYEPPQRCSVDPVQNLYSIPGHGSESTKGHGLENLKGHGLETTKGLESIRHAVEPIHEPNFDSIQEHGLEPTQRHSLDSNVGSNDYMQGNVFDSSQGSSLDALQKNKLNKPRKGLNDCIAMLKNKLVDPDPNAPAHVSVQCGSDDPIGPAPMVSPVLNVRQPSNEIQLQSLQTCPKPVQRAKKSSPKANYTDHVPPMVSPLYRGQYFNQDMQRNLSMERNPTQWRPINYDVLTPRYNNNRKEVSRRRSASHTENLLIAQQLLTAPTPETFMKISSDLYEAYHMPPQKASKSRRNVKQTTNPNELNKRKAMELQLYERTLNYNADTSRKSLDLINEKTNTKTRSRSDASRKSVEMREKTAPIRTDPPKCSADFNEKGRKKTQEILVQQHHTTKNTEVGRNIAYTQGSRKHTNNHPKNDVNVPQFKEMVFQQSIDMNVKMPIAVYNEHNFQGDHVSIPPAHASTNIESIVSSPLDLSGKVLPMDNTYVSRHDSALMLSPYDGYETLDLSKKSKTNTELLNNGDEVVDLRIKQNLQYSCSPISQPTASESLQSDVLNLADEEECVPTDLSIKRTNDNVCIKSCQINVEDTHIQDLSKNKTNAILNDDQLPLDLQRVLPTDLSHKSNTNYEQSTPTIVSYEVNASHEIDHHINYDDLNVLEEPEDLSGKVNDENGSDGRPTTPVIMPMVSETPNQICEEINNQDIMNASHTTESYFVGDSQEQISKSVYDSTSRIPHYNRKPTGSSSDSAENIDTEMDLSVTVSKGPENYSHPEISVSSNSVSYISHSTLISNSMVASIETQERITYSFQKTALNVAVTTIAGSIPVYSLLNSGMAAPFTESTNPVYTLSNACIALTKIDVAKSATFTNSLLSIPCTTIASTTPVYTLAGTTIVTAMNSGTIPNASYSIPYPPPCGTAVSESDSRALVPYTGSGSMILGAALITYDGTLECTSKVEPVTLDNDVIETIKMMPYKRRLRLFHVFKRLRYESPVSALPLPVIIREIRVNACTETMEIKPSYPPAIEDVPSVAHEEKKPIVLQDQVIDLTNDEITPKPDMDRVEDEEQSKTLVAQEIANTVTPKLEVQKPKKKTSCLRAVRIKAPAERLKSKESNDQLPNPPSTDNINVLGDDNSDAEMHTLVDSDLSLDVQMFEVSSSQQSILSGKSIVSFKKLRTRSVGADFTNGMDENTAERHFSIIKTLKVNEKGETSSAPVDPITFETVDPSMANKGVNSKFNGTSTTSAEQNINALVLRNINKLEEDDDSEDDISLATIVKQKLQNKMNKNVCETESKISLNTNTTEDSKLTKESTEKDKYIGKQDKSISQLNDTNFSVLGNIDDCTTVTKVKNKVCRKKTKKNRRNKTLVKEKIQCNEEFKKTDKNKENNKVFESINRVKMQGSVKQKESKEEYKMNQFNSDSKNKSNEMNIPVVDINETFPKVLNVLKKGKNKISEPEDDNLGVVSIQSEVFNESQKGVTEELSAEQNGNKDKVDNSVPIDPASDTTFKNSVVVPTEPCIDLTVDKNIDKDTEKLIQEAVVNKEDELPLRRSRRGKSLYVEGTEQEMQKHPVTPLESKAPLTKKQLIFSKLLLDEENNIKNSAPTDDKQQDTLKFANSICSNTENQTTKNIFLPIRSSLEEKTKPIKRKKSPPLKKKTKKKRPLNNSHDTNNMIQTCDDIQNVFKNDQNNPGNLQDGKSSTMFTEKKSNDLDIPCVTPTTTSQLQNKLDIDNNNEQNIITNQNDFATGSSEKRKILCSDPNLDNTDSSKPKKSKLLNTEEILTSLVQDENGSVRDSRHIANRKLPLAARRTRSKSVVVKSSGSMLYDPYDIELVDMGDYTEPFKPQRLSQHKIGTSKISNEKKIKTCLENVSANDVEVTEIKENNIILNDKIIRETISDSDESSKSDVPLKKYVEEKERKNSQLIEKSHSKIRINDNDPVDCDEISQKMNRKKHKKVKRTNTLIDDSLKTNADVEEETKEQLRSEQFMESFGFFSERKPRKSNLLATKKISETFHIIANESDDIDFKSKERPKKNYRSENRKAIEEDDIYKLSTFSTSPKSTLKRLKKLKAALLYCHVCKKEFRRSDNLLRHQMTLLHVSKLAEYELKIKTTPVPDDPNYLLIFKQHLDRLKVLQYKIKSKKHSKSKITLPTMQQMLADVRRTVKEQELAKRSLSRDEALFLDCCELLKDSNRSESGMRSVQRPFVACCASSYALACASEAAYGSHAETSTSDIMDYPAPRTSTLPKKPLIYTSAKPQGMEDFVMISSKANCNNDNKAQTSTGPVEPKNCPKDEQHHLVSKAPSDEVINIDDGIDMDDKCDFKSDGDVDSITAQSILNSEEVRNLEKDLLSGLKEAECKFKPILKEDQVISKIMNDNLGNNNNTNESTNELEINEKSVDTEVKAKKRTENKEKKIPDIIENIDIFEDKFDKIKRKCRSQAAAAKHVQSVVEPSFSHKSRKKSEKKKGKKSSKKNLQNTVLTKGALKGYDSIKVSILTSDIDMSAIAPSLVNSSKKKKRSSSKKKKDRKKVEESYKSDSCRVKDKGSLQNVDVYEFMDNEEPEIFGLRPSTIMERFRKINNKVLPNTSRAEPIREEVESSDTASDGDDFVYMSDAYICDDESNEGKKSPSPLKRKDVTEKNAVMDRIFKNNAVRSEKKSDPEDVPTTPAKPAADLDQLFDSLLEDEPNSSALANDNQSPIRDDTTINKKRVFTPVELSKYDLYPSKSNDYVSKKVRTPSPALSSDSASLKRISPFSSRESSPRRGSRSRFDTSPFEYGPSTSKQYDEKKYDKHSKERVHHRQKKYDTMSSNKYDSMPAKNNFMNDELDLSSKSDESLFKSHQKTKTSKDKSPPRKKETSPDIYNYKADYYDDVLSDDAGVARQRARRKCTVGKQNVLAETWSSESEPDGMPPRPNSAESVVMSISRKKKGKKKDSQVSGSRKANKQSAVKKPDVETRVHSSSRNLETCSGGSGATRTAVCASSGLSSAHMLSLPGPSGVAPRHHHSHSHSHSHSHTHSHSHSHSHPRPSTSFWADGDEEQEHVQQHGWIVGDSHKKLVTMLAHAKGRKRNNDDKSLMLE